MLCKHLKNHKSLEGFRREFPKTAVRFQLRAVDPAEGIRVFQPGPPACEHDITTEADSLSLGSRCSDDVRIPNT